MKRLLLCALALLLCMNLVACADVADKTGKTEEEKTSVVTLPVTTLGGADPTETEPQTQPESETETKTETETETTDGGTVTPPTQTTKPPQVTMSDALFIGDSRTDGMRIYSGMTGVDYFCATSMTVFGVQSASCDVAGVGNVTLSGLLAAKDYQKIYVLLGINEIYRGADAIAEKFDELLTLIRETEPEAKLFVLANFRVTAERSAKGDAINNQNINALNEKLAALCDNEHIFFIDSNPLFDDGNGNLYPAHTWDGVHFNVSPYKTWAADVDLQTGILLGQ